MELLRTRREAEEKASEIEERDMALLFLANPNEVEQRRLRERYGVSEEEYVLILVGKDGGEKLRSREHVPLDSIFALIDTMPMRRREMNDRDSG